MPPLVAPPAPDDEMPPVDDPLTDDPPIDDVLPVDPLPVASPPVLPLLAPPAKATPLDVASTAASINVLIFMILSLVSWTACAKAEHRPVRISARAGKTYCATFPTVSCELEQRFAQGVVFRSDFKKRPSSCVSA
jgi:hypothetical protein